MSDRETDILKEEIRKKVTSEITEARDSDLKAEGYKDRVLSHHNRVQSPILDLKDPKVTISEEPVDPSNLPIGISFNHSEPIPFASIEVPIKGSLDIFQKLYPHKKLSGNMFYNYGTLTYKVYSDYDVPIRGDKDRISEIKKNAKHEIEGIMKRLEKHRETMNEFFRDELPKLIEQRVETERKERARRKSDEDDLNPFK